MVHPAISLVMAGASVLALTLLYRSVREARAAGDLDAATALTLGTGLLITLPVAIVVASGGLARRPDVLGNLVAVFPGWYGQADRLAKVLLATLAAALLLRQATSKRVPVNAAGLFAIALWSVAQLASGIHGGRLVSLSSGVLLVCLAAATVLPRGRGACLGVGSFGVMLAAASGLLAVLRNDAAFVVPCQDACSGLGFTGILPNEDLLGIALAVSIPFAFLGFRGSTRYALALYLGAMAIATGSRTATITAAIVLLALLFVRPRLDALRRAPGRAAVAWLLLAAALIVSVYIPQRDWDPSALTDRPALWNVASDYIGDSPWFGYGPDRWATLAESSEIPRAAQRSAHNQWMDVLFVAGIVGAALFAAMVAAMLLSSGRGRTGVALTAATILMIGTTEGVWSIGNLDLISFSLVGLILTGAAAGRGPPDATPGDRAARVAPVLPQPELSRLNGHAPVKVLR
jgi:O-antigen ligase